MAKGLIYSLEDDGDISHIINVALSKASYEVSSFMTAASFYEAFNKRKPDLILLDLMLPDASGLDVLKRIRSDPKDDRIQIIILSAKRLVMDKVDGLDLGADDYIEKPFDILELISRVNSRFRRLAKPGKISYKGLTIDKAGHDFYLKGEKVFLTDSEFSLLFLLMSRLGEVITREDISLNLYEEEAVEESRAIDMHIASLRKKLGDEAALIKTVRSLGYKLGE